jgi:cardiolipin synthase A/B
MSLRDRLIRALHPTLHVTSGNDVALLTNGHTYFPALIKAIREARETIRIETYLYADDALGSLITTELCNAATRGVDVRLIVDGFGAMNIYQRHLSKLNKAGVHVRIFRPEVQWIRHLLRLKSTRLRRMHRKIAVIDGRLAFVGGINIIGDETGNVSPVRLDFVVRVSGPLVSEIVHAVDHQWLTLERLVRRFLVRAHQLSNRTPIHAEPTGDYRAAFLLRDNLLHRTRIQRAYARAISHARHEVILAMAYFIPSRQILEALLDASKRGVHIRLLLQGRVEYALQHYASQALYTRLLRAGIRIYEYQPGFMHAKAGVIDGRWATIGSANLDPFSLLVAREANIIVHDSRFCNELRQKLFAIMSHESQEVLADEWQSGPWFKHALRRVASALLFRLLSLTRYASNY